MVKRYRGTEVEGKQDTDEEMHWKRKGVIIRYRWKVMV